MSVAAARKVEANPAGPTQVLADFVSGLTFERVPAKVRAVLQDAIVDAIGCGIFGLTVPAAVIVRDFAIRQGGREEATLWGAGGVRVPATSAGLVHGTAIHSFDFDDHCRAKIHPGAAILPAALALAEQQDADGRTLLTALAAGYEAMIRVSLASNPSAARDRKSVV